MQITTLGELAVDGRPVRGERLAAVLRTLVDARGRAVSVGALAEAVWDGEPPQDETGAIQALVSRLRRTGVPILVAPGGYRLNADDVQVDAADARALADRAAAELRAGRPDAARLAADDARALFPAVPDLDDGDAARLFSEVAVVRAQAALAGAGALDGADLHRLVDRNPPDEPALALLVKVLAAQGRDAEALELVERVRAELADRYGADPSPVVVDAHLALLRGELAPAVATTPAAGVRTTPTLAVPPSWRRATTPLIGRDADLATVLAAVDHAPLVTLVATGGAGKTRLASEVARAVAAQGRSVRVVELAGLRSPEEVLPAVLGAIGGMDTTPARAELNVDRRLLDPVDRLRVAAADLDGLVVLDNCEHLLDAVAIVVADLLGVASPDVVVLATSRAPLGIVGEAVHRLGTLPDQDALDLLESRARAGRPGLTWDASRALELCHRLDNLPLALELAAARLRSMPVEDVLDGLSDRFGLLDDALRGLPDRHASLWAMVDWSRELLSPAERTLLQRLAVVGGSFSAEAAAAVAADLPAAQVRRGLAMLVDQSLLSLAEQDDGPARYRMLETVREYGEARLDDAGERDAAMTGLVGWAARRATELGAEFVGHGQVRAFNATALDADAMLVATRWALAHDDESAALDVLAALSWLWTVRGLHSEVVSWARRLLHLDDPRARVRSAFINGSRSGGQLPRADAAAMVGTFASVNSGVIASKRMAAIALRAVRTTLREREDELSPRTRAMAQTLSVIGTTDMTRVLEPADRLAQCGDPYLEGIGLFLRAAVLENEGDAVESRVAAREAYRRFEAVGDHWGMGMAAQGIGQWIGSGRASAESEEWLARGLHHLEAIGAFGDAWSIRVLLDVQRALRGDAEAYTRVLDVASSDQVDQGDAAQAHLGLAHIAWTRGDRDQAATHVDAAVALVDEHPVNPPQARAVTRAVAAMIHLRRAADADDRVRTTAEERATRLLRGAGNDALASSDMPVVGTYALALAELAAFRGLTEVTVELYAMGMRLGANLQMMFELDEDGAVAAIVGDEPARSAAVEPVRNLRAQTVAARVRALTDDLLGT
ncbi:BTAD domain-containing putative transcriptional regulator [Cellulomonas edaphi]|uniref:BTAD domain-containing putative transcriptional regulator n=1 Tax=Cellulomonas edaphi TaxID=3053468 RepID=A0ABT7S2L3_9CELL|nr:BTAD domain-containing putative transcriptional regulator [Cellulomons edaphi]MDM7829851.1 BTAD domain-containing putative transcriptional regulator [Cellulomons edaphi]